MCAAPAAIVADLEQRQLISQMTGALGLADYLAASSRTLYAGFDPTASSLHIGSLVPLLALRRFQLAGHKPIALVGGATGLIGDPSFKAQERSLNTPDVVAQWTECLRQQVCQFIDFDAGANAAEVVNNLEWMKDLDTLTFLRDVGKHFSINNMVQKESVKQRLEREGEGISFTEFSYMILQSYDFAELYQRYNCTLQIGGSDQWGNIIGGVDLVRRLHGGEAHGLTLPLVTQADGTKFGKTEKGTVWLDPTRTSPYAFYQFWLQTADADVYKFLRYFSFLPIAELNAIEQADKAATGRPQAQSVLAKEVTELVHGHAGLQAAERITAALFDSSLTSLTENDLEQLKLDGLPSSELDFARAVEQPLTQLLVDSGVVASGKQVKDALNRNAILVNGRALGADDNMNNSNTFAVDNAFFGRYFVLRMGKKNYHLFDRGAA